MWCSGESDWRKNSGLRAEHHIFFCATFHLKCAWAHFKWIPFEPHFPHWPILGDEGRQSVGLLEIVVEEDDLGVLGRTCSTHRRLRMAAAAAVEIHGRPQTIFDCLSLLKLGQARVEQRGLT